MKARPAVPVQAQGPSAVPVVHQVAPVGQARSVAPASRMSPTKALPSAALPAVPTCRADRASSLTPTGTS